MCGYHVSYHHSIYTDGHDYLIALPPPGMCQKHHFRQFQLISCLGDVQPLGLVWGKPFNFSRSIDGPPQFEAISYFVPPQLTSCVPMTERKLKAVKESGCNTTMKS